MLLRSTAALSHTAFKSGEVIRSTVEYSVFERLVHAQVGNVVCVEAGVV